MVARRFLTSTGKLLLHGRYFGTNNEHLKHEVHENGKKLLHNDNQSLWDNTLLGQLVNNLGSDCLPDMSIFRCTMLHGPANGPSDLLVWDTDQHQHQH